ncbi:MAG: response regulator [Phycisphaerales bacterium]|nr:MAG: response regulator [Phycisphaerales bacterium]
MENAKILVVDDDTDLTMALKAILENAQYKVMTAADRTEGMRSIRNEKPDLAILDVMMASWQDGFEMSRELKSDPELRDIPILVLTSVKDRTGIDFKSDAGDPAWLPVQGFLDKPVESGALLAEIERLLSEKG